MSCKYYIVCQFDISNDIFHLLLLTRSIMSMIVVTGTILFLHAITTQWSGSPASTLNSQQVQQVLSQHNQVRARFGVPPLVYDEKLATFGKNYLDTLSTCTLVHNPNSCGFSPGNPVGENLSGSGGTFLMSLPQLVNEWIMEGQNYPGDSMPYKYDESTGHFTQMIWHDTKSVGCALKQCGNSQVLICNYFPTGNTEGFYVQRQNTMVGRYVCPGDNGVRSGSGNEIGSDSGIGSGSGGYFAPDYQ